MSDSGQVGVSTEVRQESLTYRFVRGLLDRSVRLFYRRIQVVGREQIPASGPAVIVANHPNSIADAFLLGSQLTARKLNFIAKDSITRAPVVGWIVRQLGVVGVARAMDYNRRRDQALERNKAAMGTCVPRLVAGELVAIFGEGVSTDSRRLHIVRKGAMRFGYAAEQQAEFRLGLVWIPVGITYSAKQRVRSDVLIRVGAPFRLTDLDPDPAANEPAVLQRGTARLQRDLEGLIVNIERQELAGLIDGLAALAGNPAAPLDVQVKQQQSVARAVQYFNVTEPQRLAELQAALRGYHQHLEAARFTDEIVRQRRPAVALGAHLREALVHGLLLLLNVYGWINGLVPRWFARIARPLGRRRLSAAEMEDSRSGGKPLDTAREAWFATLGGWIGAAVSFPLLMWLVFRWASRAFGFTAAVAVAVLYGLTLVPSWLAYVRRRDQLRYHFGRAREALAFLRRPRAAFRLQVERRRLHRQVRALVAAYENKALFPR